MSDGYYTYLLHVIMLFLKSSIVFIVKIKKIIHKENLKKKQAIFLIENLPRYALTIL
jgi:hypothetical protein